MIRQKCSVWTLATGSFASSPQSMRISTASQAQHLRREYFMLFGEAIATQLPEEEKGGAKNTGN